MTDTKAIRACFTCGRKKGDAGVELRPYGPKGEDVCFECAFATPEAKQATERQFMTQLEAVPGGLVAVGLDVGPMPTTCIENEIKAAYENQHHIVDDAQ